MPPADPAPATPDWIARFLGYENGADFDSCYLENTYYEVPKREIVRILATLRERTLREAAGVCLKIREAYIDTADKYIGGTHTVFGSKGAALGEGADAILSLIAQPPKEA